MMVYQKYKSLYSLCLEGLLKTNPYNTNKRFNKNIKRVIR